jgi:hypothetical protein
LTTTEAASPASGSSLASLWWRPPAFLLGFGLLVLGLYEAGSGVYKSADYEYDQGRLARIAKRHVLLLGASHGHDLDLDAAGLDGVDMANGGQDLYEMNYMARTVKDVAPVLDTVIITLSYFSFVFDNAAYTVNGVQTRIGRRIRLYSSFGRLAFIPGDAAQFLKAKLEPVVTNDHFMRGFRRLPREHAHDDDAATDEVETTPEGGEPEQGGEPTEAKPHRTEAERKARRGAPGFFRHHARGRCREYAGLTHTMLRNHPGLTREVKATMVKLARDLKRDKIRVIFFTPPYLRPYSDCFEERFQRLTRDTGRYLERTTGARYFDFSMAPEFIDHEEYFHDSDHLNDDGKLAFSRMFAAAVGKRRAP